MSAEDGFFDGAIALGEEQVPGGGAVKLPEKYEMLAVRCKADGTVHVLDQDVRLAAENGRAVKLRILFFGLLPAHKIDVVAVRRKGQTIVARGSRGHNFLVRAGRDVAQPKGLQAVLFEGLEEVFAVRRNGRLGNVSVVRNVFNAEFLEGGVDLLCCLRIVLAILDE